MDVALDMLSSLEIAQQQAESVMSSGQSRSWQSDAALALLNSAIILYVRATKTSSRYRHNVDFVREFTREQRDVHSELCNLRDNAIAHFGPGRLEDGNTWHVESVFVPLDTPEDLRIMNGSRRIFKQRQMQERAKKQIHRALIISEQVTQKRNSAVVADLNDLIDDPEFVALVHSHHANLTDFFTSEEEADRALASRVGRRTGAVSH